jgi:hypothetical protein
MAETLAVTRKTVPLRPFDTALRQKTPHRATTRTQFAGSPASMLTLEQMLIGGGLLFLAFAIIYGLALKGGHGKRRR